MEITRQDLDFITFLHAQPHYPGNTLAGLLNANQLQQFSNLKSRLNAYAYHYYSKYNETLGPLHKAFNPNAVSRHGEMRLAWCGIYKGCSNKQYAGQISFVMIPGGILDVGFYFGNATAHQKTKNESRALNDRLKELGQILYTALKTQPDLYSKFQSLFDFGFKAYVRDMLVDSDQWLDAINTQPANTKIIYHLQPENGKINFAMLDACVSMVTDLLDALPPDGVHGNLYKAKRRPLTPDERAMQAKRRKIIGDKGELEALKYEQSRIAAFPGNKDYPKHVAKESDEYHFDILSIDETGEEIFIEVKSTTRLITDPHASKFYMSFEEKMLYENAANRYHLYRVYDVEGVPQVVAIDMQSVTLAASSYIGIIPENDTNSAIPIPQHLQADVDV